MQFRLVSGEIAGACKATAQTNSEVVLRRVIEATTKGFIHMIATRYNKKIRNGERGLLGGSD